MISTLHIFKHRPEDYRKWLAVANITAKDCRKGKNKPHTRMSGAPTIGPIIGGGSGQKNRRQRSAERPA